LIIAQPVPNSGLPARVSIPLQDDDAVRYRDAMHQLLRAVKALPRRRRLYDAQRRSGSGRTETGQPTRLGAESAPAAAQPAGPPLSLDLNRAADDKPTRALHRWIEVALPRSFEFCPAKEVTVGPKVGACFCPLNTIVNQPVDKTRYWRMGRTGGRVIRQNVEPRFVENRSFVDGPSVSLSEIKYSRNKLLG
jgi:hypothetical protein